MFPGLSIPPLIIVGRSDQNRGAGVRNSKSRLEKSAKNVEGIVTRSSLFTLSFKRFGMWWTWTRQLVSRYGYHDISWFSLLLNMLLSHFVAHDVDDPPLPLSHGDDMFLNLCGFGCCVGVDHPFRLFRLF